MPATTYYSDTAGSNTAPYDTWPKAATDPQTIIDLAVAGDTCYYRGTKVLTAPIDVDTASGSLANGYIKHIGCNAAGVNDGTYYTLNGNSAVANIIKGAAKNLHWFENFEVKLATGNGITGNSTTCIGWIFKNCYVHNCGATGFGQNSTYFRNCMFLNCRAESNTGVGFGDGYNSVFAFCKAINNGAYGFFDNITLGSFHIGCLAHNNVAYNYYGVPSSQYINCIADGWNGSAPANAGIYISASGTGNAIIGCRITNCAIGIQLAAGAYVTYDYCGLYGNTAPTTVAAGAILSDGGHNTNMAADGYVGGRGGNSADNFNLINGATPAECRWTQASLGDAVNYAYVAAGLPPNPDFPAVGNTRSPDTTDGVVGTQAALATDADYLALEAGRNVSAGADKILLGSHEHIQGVQIDGTLVALAVPDAPTNLVFTNVTDNGFRVAWTPGARSETYKVYVDGVLHTSGISAAYLDIGSRSPLTTYSITVKGTNITGDSAASTASTVKTLASDGANDATTLSTDTVTVATISGSPKIVGSGASNKIYDVRIINKALSVDADSYYWKDVLENEGKVVIPR